jgi:uncharacterized protein YjiS (DUF1127 family)
MAYASVSRAASGGIAERLFALLKTIKTSIARRQKYQTTLRELNALTDRELADLGIRRSLIATIAHEAAYGK